MVAPPGGWRLSSVYAGWGGGVFDDQSFGIHYLNVRKVVVGERVSACPKIVEKFAYFYRPFGKRLSAKRPLKR